MSTKKTDTKGILNLFMKLAVWQKAAVAVLALIVIGGIVALIIAMSTSDEPEVLDTSSLDNSSIVESSEPEADVVASQTPSSEETSSETSSEEASKTESKPTSKPSSTANTSSKAVVAPPKPAAKPATMPETYLPKYADLYKANKDVAGWIQLDGTKLNYPVMQGKDNYYYLNKNEYKKQSGWGVPYMDVGVTITEDYQSTNTIIYGHSDDKNGLQCSAVKGYRKIDFYKQHPTIDFDTVYAEGTYKVVSFFITNQNKKNWFPYHTFFNAKDDAEFNNYIANAKQRSYINTTVDVLPTDKLLTIQTCEDTNTNNYNRLVLVARKVRPGEDASVDTSAATQNGAQVLPK